MTEPAVGEHVRVPWGLDTLDGTVLETRDTGAGVRVVVRVSVPGAGTDNAEDLVLTLPLDALQQGARLAEIHPAGYWLSASTYEQQVSESIRRIVQQAAPHPHILEAHRAQDRGADFVISDDGRRVAIEIKHIASRSRLSLAQVDQLLAVVTENNMPVVLITNADLSTSAAERLRQTDTTGRFHWVKWRSPADDPTLEYVLTRLLRAR